MFVPFTIFVNIGVHYGDDFEEMQLAPGTAPHDVNSYADGSVRYPSHRFAAMGAYAVYHKPPCTHQHNITGDEVLATTFCEEIDSALQLHSPVQGALTSSTRAEAAALLLALMRPISLNIGVDNAFAVPIANRIIHGLHTKHRKPWELQPNGDIWCTIEQIIDERGEGTTKVTKLNGHATQQHIDDKVITAENKAGNEIADRLANDANEGFPKHVRELANLYVHRTNQYREPVHVIQLTMIRVIEAMQQRKASLALLQSPDAAP